MTPKHFRFAQSLLDDKRAVLLSDEKADAFVPQKGINAADEIAALIDKL